MSERNPIPETIRADAADWLARNEGDRPEAVEAEFHAWLSRDLRHRLAYAEAERNWRESLLLANSAMGRARVLGRAPIYMQRSTHLAAAALAVVLVVGLLSVRTVRDMTGISIGTQVEARSYQTEPGETRTWQLDGGTVLTLSGDSLVRALPAKGASHLELVRGHARIRAAATDAAPTEVSAAGISVQTYGASFDVSCAPAANRIDVLAGQVQASLPGGETRSLNAGDGLAVPAAGQPKPTALASPPPHAIRPSTDMTVGEAVQALNQRNTVQIHLAASDVAERRLTGAFRIDDPEGFADAVAALDGLDVVHSPGSIVLASRQR
jgi:transmembrane sensor